LLIDLRALCHYIEGIASVTVVLAILITVGVLVTLGQVIRRAAFSHNRLPVTAEWIADLSQDRCRSLLRLQCNSARRMTAKLRRERCQVFKDYLQRLQDDFGRATLALKVLMVQSREDRPDLAAALLHHQLAFGCGMVAARSRLFLYRWGIGSVDVSRLVRVFEAVAVELRAALPADSGLR